MEATEINTEKPGATMAIPDRLTPQQGIQVLIDVALHAISKGIFENPDDIKVIHLAIDTFRVKEPDGPVPSGR
jgi:hypothetical protein